ncbi:hypothetical protein ACLVWU_14125 [Bdellovibrio sp. HCB290]|uniref:hypothetical protein n=1 Tax=Bdellovibrio sp. HCB290 TaxID=3394356 RepID=UPI0039B4C17C
MKLSKFVVLANLSFFMTANLALAGGGGGCRSIQPNKNLFSCQISSVEYVNQIALDRDYQPNIIYGGREDLQNALKTVGTTLFFIGGSQNDVTGPENENSCPVNVDEQTRIYNIVIPMEKMLPEKLLKYNKTLGLYGSEAGIVSQDSHSFDSNIFSEYNWPSTHPVDNPFRVEYTFLKVSRNPGESQATLEVKQSYFSKTDREKKGESVIRASMNCDL